MSQISRALKVKKSSNAPVKLNEKSQTTTVTKQTKSAATVAKTTKSRRSQSVDQQLTCQTQITDFFQRRSSRKTEAISKLELQLAMEKRIIEGKEDGLKIEYFADKGRGIIATRPFQRGDYVVEYFGDLISVAEAKRREEKYAADPTVGCYMFYFCFKGRRLCVDATSESSRLGRLVNHKRNGNCVTKAITFSKPAFVEENSRKKGSATNANDETPHVILVATRDISTGEEILYDYGDRSPDSIASHPWLAS